MSKFAVGERIKPKNWPGQPPAEGGVIDSIRQGQDGGTYVLWDNGERTITGQQYLQPADGAEPAALPTHEEVQRWLKPLPTVPYTVILVAWRDPSISASRMFTLADDGSWSSADGVADEDLDIIDFEIVSQPRAVVAKEVLEWVRAGAEGAAGHESVPLNTLPRIERWFGVSRA